MTDKFRRKKTPRHVRLDHSIMASEAYRSLTGNAVKVLLALVSLDNGQRNGQIAFSTRTAAGKTGLSTRTCLRCLKELEGKGFIACTQKGSFSRKVQHASLWRYTWQAWPEGRMGPTRDYEKWKPDGNSRMQFSRKPDAISSDHMATPPLTGAEIAAVETGNLRKPDVSTSARIATLTLYQGDAAANRETTGWKHASPVDRAKLAELRSALEQHLIVSEVGEQSRIASAIGCPPGTFSKFRSGKNLPQEYRERLRHALTNRLPRHSNHNVAKAANSRE